jgi:hypothetical protein
VNGPERVHPAPAAGRAVQGNGQVHLISVNAEQHRPHLLGGDSVADLVDRELGGRRHRDHGQQVRPPPFRSQLLANHLGRDAVQPRPGVRAAGLVTAAVAERRQPQDASEI